MTKVNPVAVQLYSLREALAHDFESTIRSVADIGYAGVEPFGGMPGGLEATAALFGELELEVCSGHVPYPDDANKDAVLAIAEAYGLERICIAYLPPEEFETSMRSSAPARSSIRRASLRAPTA